MGVGALTVDSCVLFRWPVPDVRKAIMDGLTSATEFSEEDADNFLEELKEEGRYILEVY